MTRDFELHWRLLWRFDAMAVRLPPAITPQVPEHLAWTLVFRALRNRPTVLCISYTSVTINYRRFRRRLGLEFPPLDGSGLIVPRQLG